MLLRIVKPAKHKAFFLSLEALVSLLIAVSAFYYFTAPKPFLYNSVYENQLAYDILLSSLKSKSTLAQIQAFGEGDVMAKTQLEVKYSSLLKQLGASCLALRFQERELSTCGEGVKKESKNIFTARALAPSHGEFSEVNLLLYFSS